MARATKATVAELFADVAQNPDDDEIRHVLADALLERGDPRGELMMLQLSGGDPRRVRELLDAYAEEWIDPLARHTGFDKYRFERGFLDELVLGEPRDIRRVIGHPMWATVRRIDLAIGKSLPVALLCDPVMRVEHLGHLSREITRQLLRWDRVPYRSLNVSFPANSGPSRRSDIKLLVDSKARLAPLRVLELQTNIEPTQFRWLWKSWLGDQLECFGAISGLPRLRDWIVELNERASELRSARLSALPMVDEWVELTRDDRGRFSIAEVRGTESGTRFGSITPVLPAALSSLPHGALTVLRFIGSAPMPRQLAAIQAAAAQAEIPLELPG